MSSQIEGGVVTRTSIEEGQEGLGLGSRRVEDGRRPSMIIENAFRASQPTLARAITVIALCALLYCTRTRLDAHLHSWALLDHPLHTPLIV